MNLAINSGRRARREREHLRVREETVAEPALDALWPLVIQLPPRQRAAVVLRYYLDLSESDMAAAMGCRPGTVKAHLSKALNRLRQEMDPS